MVPNRFNYENDASLDIMDKSEGHNMLVYLMGVKLRFPVSLSLWYRESVPFLSQVFSSFEKITIDKVGSSFYLINATK